eukprot:2271113-Prymnesium_polylepis.1
MPCATIAAARSLIRASSCSSVSRGCSCSGKQGSNSRCTCASISPGMIVASANSRRRPPRRAAGSSARLP